MAWDQTQSRGGGAQPDAEWQQCGAVGGGGSHMQASPAPSWEVAAVQGSGCSSILSLPAPCLCPIRLDGQFASIFNNESD